MLERIIKRKLGELTKQLSGSSPKAFLNPKITFGFPLKEEPQGLFIHSSF